MYKSPVGQTRVAPFTSCWLLTHHSMQAEAVDSVACTFVPADVKDACDTKVDAAVRHAVQMFEDYISPATVCKPVCPEDLLSDRSRFLHASYPQCSQCRFVATEIRNADCLQHSDRGCAEGELAHVAEQSCKSLPEPFVAECTGFLQSYGGTIWLLLLLLCCNMLTETSGF